MILPCCKASIQRMPQLFLWVLIYLFIYLVVGCWGTWLFVYDLFIYLWLWHLLKTALLRFYIQILHLFSNLMIWTYANTWYHYHSQDNRHIQHCPEFFLCPFCLCACVIRTIIMRPLSRHSTCWLKALCCIADL